MLNSFGKALVAISLNGVALGVAGWVGWDIWNSGVLTGVRPVSATVSPEALDLQTDSVDIHAIVSAQLFGAELTTPQPVARQPVAPTRLNLKLAGVIAIGSANQGIALIEAGRGVQHVVKVGQVIATTDARLAEVARDHVLIERNGQLEKLSILRPELESGPLESHTGGSSLAENSFGLEHLPTAMQDIPVEGQELNESDQAYEMMSEQMQDETLPDVSDSQGQPDSVLGDSKRRLVLPF